MAYDLTQKGTKNGLVIFNEKEGLEWHSFKEKYKEFLNTSAFYVIRTPTSKDGKGNLVKLGISSVGSSEIKRRLSDYESYYDGDFTVLHLRIWHRYVKNTNQNRAPQQKFELAMKRNIRKQSKPKYGTEWYDSNDLELVFNVMAEIDKNNEEIEYIPPRRNSQRMVKEVAIDTLVRFEGKIGAVFFKETQEKKKIYSVVFFNRRNKINLKDIDIFDQKEIKEGIQNLEEFAQDNEAKFTKLNAEWQKAKTMFGIR